MPTLPLVLLAALFGLGAALLFVGLVNADFLSIVLGGVLVGLGLRLRRQVRERVEGAEGAAAGEADDGEEAGEVDPEEAAEDDEVAAAEEGSGEASSEAASPEVGDDGLVLAEAEAATEAGDDGGTLHGAGYRLQRGDTGEPVDGEKLRLGRDGAQVLRLVTDPEQIDELQADELAPGEPVVLVPQRTREGRIEGVRVFDESIDHLAGWLPKKVADKFGAEIRRGGLRARSLYEWRDADGQRRELDVLVHRPDAVADE